jgi:uncharacterized protein with HEPN domain
MSKDYREYLNYIAIECDFIASSSKDLSFYDFFDDEILKRAIVRSLEIIGEATKKVDVDQKLKYPDIAWKSMAGIRERLIHDYMGVNYLIV